MLYLHTKWSYFFRITYLHTKVIYVTSNGDLNRQLSSSQWQGFRTVSVRKMYGNCTKMYRNTHFRWFVAVWTHFSLNVCWFDYFFAEFSLIGRFVRWIFANLKILSLMWHIFRWMFTGLTFFSHTWFLAYRIFSIPDF